MEKTELILYAYTFRSRAERVIWVLNELKLDYKLVRLDPSKGDTSTPEFLKLNPGKKIPVLVHKDHVFTESLAIMEYLNRIANEGVLVPEKRDENYAFRNLIYYMLSEVEAYLWIAD